MAWRRRKNPAKWDSMSLPGFAVPPRLMLMVMGFTIMPVSEASGELKLARSSVKLQGVCAAAAHGRRSLRALNCRGIRKRISAEAMT